MQAQTFETRSQSLAWSKSGHNPALFPLLLYLGAWYVNDLFSISVMGTFITLNQLAIVVGVLHVLRQPVSWKGTKTYYRIASWFIAYNAATVIAVLYSLLIYGGFNVNYFSIVANTIWFLTVGRYLSHGLTPREWKLVIRVLLIGTLVAVSAGILEYFKGSPLLNTPYGILPTTFWIRGLHTDKVDFGTSMIVGILIMFGLFQLSTNSFRKTISLPVIIGIGVFLFLSRSWTSYVGAVVAMLFVITARTARTRKNNLALFLGSLFVIVGLVFYLPQNPLFQQTEIANTLKFNTQIDQYETYNFRYQSVVASFQRFLEAPLLGGGFGRASEISKVILNDPKAPLPHTGFATLMIEQGLLGLIPFIGLLLVLSRLIIKAWQGNIWSENVPIPMRILIVGLAGVLLVRFLVYFFYLTLSFYFSWAALLLAATVPQAHPAANQQPDVTG